MSSPDKEFLDKALKEMKELGFDLGAVAMRREILEKIMQKIRENPEATLVDVLPLIIRAHVEIKEDGEK